MSILTKILLAFVIIAVFPVVYFAAGVLNINQAWRTKVASLNKMLEADQKQNELLKNGDFKAQTSNYTPPLAPKGELGVAQLTAARDALKVGRSRMWYATLNPQSLDDAAQTLIIQMQGTAPNSPLKEHGIKDQAQIFVFSNPPNDGMNQNKSAFDKSSHHYLGEFTVNNLVVGPEGIPASADLPLKAASPLTAAEWQLLRGGSGELVVYDAMPSDQHDVFLGLSEQEIRTYIPDQTAEQYLADGKDIEKFPALKADPELSQSVVDGVDPTTGAKIKVFHRPLRRYDLIFRDAAARLTAINNRLLMITKELEYAKRAEAKATAQLTKLDEIKAAAQDEMNVLQREQKIAQTHLTALQAKVAELTQELKTQLATNRRLAEEIAGRKTAMLPAPPANATAPLANATAQAGVAVAPAVETARTEESSPAPERPRMDLWALTTATTAVTSNRGINCAPRRRRSACCYWPISRSTSSTTSSAATGELTPSPTRWNSGPICSKSPGSSGNSSPTDSSTIRAPSGI